MVFSYDSTGIDPQEFKLLPDGWFPFRIYQAEEMKSKEKGYAMVLCKCECLDERYKGQQIWHYVTFIPKGMPGDGINVHFRKSIGVPFGGNDTVDSADWEGKKFMGKVVTEEYGGKMRNKIAQVSPLTSTVGTVGSDEEIPF